MGLVRFNKILCVIKHMGHSVFAQTHTVRKMGFNYTHLLIANVGQKINVLRNKATESMN